MGWIRSFANIWRDRSSQPLRLGSLPVLVLLGLGAAERAAWNLLRPSRGAGGEAFDVARAIGSGRGVADAFGPGTGPTAHLLPVSPGIAGGVYWLFGVGSGPAEVVLATWSIGLCLGSFLLFDRVFARLKVERRTRLVALGFLCLAPTYLPQEAVDFRVWEGGLAVFLLALFLDRSGASEARPGMSVGMDLALVVLAALLFVVNPLCGLGALAILVVRWRRRDAAALALRAAIYFALLAVVLVPWTLRNQRVMGAPVVLRSNLGLELAVGEYPGEFGPGSGDDRFMARLRQVHPRQSDEAMVALRAAGGEVAYAQALQRDTIGWIRAHPAAALVIAVRHLGQIVAPPVWGFRLWNPPGLARLRAALATLAGVLGTAGLLVGLARWPRRWAYLSLAVLVPVALFAPFQPVMRYTYLFYAIFAYCAAHALAQVGAWRRSRGSQEVRPA